MQKAHSLATSSVILLCLGLVGSAAAPQADTPEASIRSMTISRLPQPPVVDGTLGEEEWQYAAGASGFYKTVSALPADDQTSVRLAYDDENLYVAFRCEHPYRKIRAEATRHDEDVWKDDSVEVYLQTEPGSEEYLHFLGNSIGTPQEEDTRHGGLAWDGAWEYAAARTQEAWTAEMAIPLRTLGLDSLSGRTLAVNFCRNQQITTDEPPWIAPSYPVSTSWAPVRGPLFKDISTFGRVKCVDETAVSFFQALTDPLYTGVGVRGTLANPTGQARGVQARLSLRDDGRTRRFRRQWKLPAGAVEEVLWTRELPPGTYDVAVALSGLAEDPREIASWPAEINLRSPLTVRKFFLTDRIEAAIDAGRTAHLGAGKVRFELTCGDERIDLAEICHPGPDGDWKAILDLGGAEPGPCRLRAVMLGENGEKVFEEVRDFTKPPRPEWLGNDIGTQDALLPPYTPVEVRGNVVSVLQREYDFGGPGAFPAKIVSRGEDLLAGAIRLEAVCDGRRISWTSSETRILEQTPTRCLLRSTRDCRAVRLDVRAEIAFDGFVRYDVELRGVEADSLDSLRLVVPLKRRFASLYNTSGDWRVSGRIPGEGLHLPFLHAVWVGDETRGLGWFAECPENWALEDGERAFEIVPEGDRTAMRVNFIDRPIALDRPLELTFGLQATPIKPPGAREDLSFFDLSEMYDAMNKTIRRTENGESRMISRIQQYAEQGCDVVILWNDWTEHMGYPTTRRFRERLEAFSRAVHEAEMQLLVYIGFQIGDASPEYALYKDEILIDPPGTPWKAGFDSGYGVSYASPHADFMLWELRELVAADLIDGVYMDGTCWPPLDRNTAHGAGYYDRAGNLRPSRQLFAYRDFQHRLARMGRAIDPDFYIEAHANPLLTMTQTFCDSILSAEMIQEAIRVRGGLRRDILPLPRFRAQFLGEPYGFHVDLLGYYSPYETLAVSLLHGATVRQYTPYDLIEQAREDLGPDGGRWIPYYENPDAIRSEDPDVFVSAWQYEGSGLLLYVVNLTDEAREARIEIDGDALGLPEGLRAWDYPAREPVEMDDTGRIRLSAEPRRVRFVYVSDAPPSPRGPEIRYERLR